MLAAGDVRLALQHIIITAAQLGLYITAQKQRCWCAIWYCSLISFKASGKVSQASVALKAPRCFESLQGVHKFVRPPDVVKLQRSFHNSHLLVEVFDARNLGALEGGLLRNRLAFAPLIDTFCATS